MTKRAPTSRRELLNARLEDGATIERARIGLVELPPAQQAGRHRHPCHVIGYVLSGLIRFQVADGPSELLVAGDAFHEPAGVEVLHFDNASDSEPAVFLACYLLPPGETRLIEMMPSPS